MELLVLAAQKVDMTDEKTGKKVKGVTFFYIDPSTRAESPLEKGYIPLKNFTSDFNLDDFAYAPGYYDLDFRMRKGANGKGVAYLHGLDYKRPMGANPKPIGDS